MLNLLYQTKSINKLNITISAKASFKVILNNINNITLEDINLPQEHFHYALLELINNSLRAQREKKCLEKPISLQIKTTSRGYLIELKDWGGGFSTESLPYKLEENYDKIDMESNRFQEYREKNQYKRFGMGLLSAKKVFPIFSVAFHKDGIITQYVKGCTDGTIIHMGVDIL